MKLKIEPFSIEDKKEVLRLLSEFELPTKDLTINKLQDFIVAREEGGCVIGAVGIEAYQDLGLLRSLVVHPNHQAKGLGRLLTNEIESFARKKGIRALYLLTTTAADFFLKLGYQFAQKATAPDPIKETEEFKSICPESAVCLYKQLESENWAVQRGGWLYRIPHGVSMDRMRKITAENINILCDVIFKNMFLRVMTTPFRVNRSKFKIIWI